MGYKYNKLRGKIVEVYGTQDAFSNVLGVTKQTVSRKMNGTSSFSPDDIREWSAKLGIDLKDIHDYFFA